jgi:hypothetical protein
MKKIVFVILLISIIFLLTGCADVSDITYNNPDEHVYGFWGGTWHGMIMFPSFIGSLIWDDVAVYAVNNNGAWYNFGYVGGFFTLLKIFSALLNNNKK